MLNPYLSDVSNCVDLTLAAGHSGLSETELLSHLRRVGLVPLASMSSHQLYCVHFLMRNALYQLAAVDSHKHWCFSLMGVDWVAKDSDALGSALTTSLSAAGLSEYYLDMANLGLSDVAVEDLLQGFWRRYQRHAQGKSGDVQAALTVLELSSVHSLAGLKTQYRRLVMDNHPDRGGSKEKMQALTSAFSILKRSLQ